MFTDKAAIVTGSGRGIGRAIALALAARHARVVVNDVNAEHAQQVVAEINTSGGQAFAYPIDVTEEAQVRAMVATCLSRFGRVDIMVNNAGIVHTAPLGEISVADWDQVLAVNLKSVFLCCREVFPVMRRQGGGKIVNVASVAGKRGGGLLGNACYAASKGGVIAFTKTLAREGAPYSINVNAVTPAFTSTAMTSGIAPQERERILKLIPLGRVGQPEDVAKAVCFLASDQADYITGEIMDVDGGLMMD